MTYFKYYDMYEELKIILKIWGLSLLFLLLTVLITNHQW